MWPKLLDMSKDECKRLLRRTELEAYAGIVSALRAQGDLTKEKKHLLNELAATLSISTERHRAEVRRAVNDEKLSTVAERLSGPNNSAEWSIEGRRLIPLMPRLVPQTVFSLTANQAANAAFSHNLTLPLPSETAKKEAPAGNENNGASVRISSPSSNSVVLPSGLSIPIKGGPDVDIESSLMKKPRRDSGNSQPLEAGTSSTPSQAMQPTTYQPCSLLPGSTSKSPTGHTLATSRSLSVPASKHHTAYTLPVSKQHSTKPVVSQLSPPSQAASSVPIKGGYSSTQSPLKFTFTKTTTSTGRTTPTCSAQKVILVSSSATSFTPSILQRSHSSPSSKSAMVKPGAKQSVILTALSGQSSMARQTEVMSSSKQTGQSLRPHAVGVSSMVKQTVPTRLDMTSGQSMTSTDPGLATVKKTPSANIGLTGINSTVITARTTASVISSHMTSYVSPNMAGKPRGRAVSKQKLLKQATIPPTFSGDPSASKKHIRTQQDAGMKMIAQSLSASANKPQRVSGPANTMDAVNKAPMATATMATAKPSNVVAGHKVIISTTSAGVTPHHVAMATPLIRTKPSGSVSNVVSKTLPGSTKLVSSGIMGSTGVNNPKLMQTIKATTTSNMSQTVTGVNNSKSSLVTHKCFSSSPQTILTEPTKQPQAHNIASTLLQRPRISMVTGVSATTTASTFSPSGIRFPAPHSTSGFTLTTVKSSGAKRMRTPITMVTGPSQAAQKRPLSTASPSPSMPAGSSSTSVSSSDGKQATDKTGGVNRGILGSCSHPNSEWIDYDGLLPDTPASSAIKALLEFRSLPDSAKLSPTIDLGIIGSPTSSARSSGSQPTSQGNAVPSRPQQPTPRVPQPSTDRTAAGSVLEGFSKFSPNLLSNVQSRLKQALLSERTVKPASAASFLQTATMEVEKALQEQNKALLAKQEGTSKQTSAETSGVEPSESSQASLGDGKESQPVKDQVLTVSIQEQGENADASRLSTQDVTTFVDQFEQFVEREAPLDKVSGAVSGQQEPSRSDQRSVSPAASKSVDRRTDQSSQDTSRSKVTSVEVVGASDWPTVSTNQSQEAEAPLPVWTNQMGLETIHSSGKKGGASVVMESGSIDITQMKIEDFTSQRRQDVEETEDEKEDNVTSSEESPTMNQTAVSPTTSSVNSGAEEPQGVRISSRKRKAPAPIDEEPGPTSMCSWARAAFNLLQRVMRFRGANRSKGDLNAASWFTRPVAAAEAPGYTNVIKTPMDFGTIKRKLESGQYDDFAGFHGDMMLVHNNCVQYNPPGHEIRRDCEEVFQFYTTEYAKLMERWERPSPKKSKSEDLHVDKTKPVAARSISLK